MTFHKKQEDYIAKIEEAFRNLREANIPERGVITQVLMPNENQHDARNPNYSRTYPVLDITLDSNGIKGDRHYATYTREVGRNAGLLPRGVEFSGNRHMMAISDYDCKVLSDRLGKKITPEQLGTNLVISREDGQDYSLSALPQEAYLVIAPEDSETLPIEPIAVLVRHGMQKGCKVTGLCVSKEHGDKSLINRFKAESTTNRGLVLRAIYPTPNKPALIKPGQKVYFLYSDGISE